MATATSVPPLFVKAYFADSVEDTLDRAHVELGPDALLLNERETPPESRHLGAFEVVFGVRRSAQPRSNAMVDLGERIWELPDAVDRRRSAARPAAAEQTGWRGVVGEHLAASGVEPSLAAEIDSAVQEKMRARTVVQIGRVGQTWSTADMLAEASAAMEERFEVAPELARISAFIGAPGVGKTTALVKLVLVKALALGRKVWLVSADDRRIGAAAQFEAYAAILGAPCRTIACTTSGLGEAVDAAPSDSMVFIDTPGFRASSAEEDGRQVIDFLRQRQDVDAHLVLTASMREVDVRRTVDCFAAFRPGKLLFARLDETEAAGSILSEAVRTGKPLSFFSSGPLVPEDIAPAAKDRVVRALVRHLPQRIQAKA